MSIPMASKTIEFPRVTSAQALVDVMVLSGLEELYRLKAFLKTDIPPVCSKEPTPFTSLARKRAWC